MASRSVPRRKRTMLPPDIANFIFKALDYSTDGIAIGSIDGTILYCNKAWFDLHNWAPDYEVRGRNIRAIERKVLKPVLSEAFKAINARGRFVGTFGITRPDGHYHDILINAQAVKRFNPPIVIAILRDVTELVQTRKKVERINVELSVLNEIHRIIYGARDRKAVTRRILHALGDFVGASAMGIYEAPRGAEQLDLIDCYGLPERIRRRVQHMHIADNAFRKILKSRRSVVLEEDLPGHRGGRKDIRKAMGFKRVIGLVFRSSPDRDYLVIIGFKKDEHVDAEVRRFLETAANQFGIALDRAEMIETLGRREHELARRMEEIEVFAKLHNSMVSSEKRPAVLRGMFRIICKHVGSQGMAMYRIARGAEYAELVDVIGLPADVVNLVRRVPMKSEAFSRILASRRLFVLEEEMQGFRGGRTDVRRRLGVKTTIGHMFRTGGDVDYLVVSGFEKKKHITPEIRRFFASVGRHFSIAVERLDFIEKLSAREKELHTLTARLMEAGEEERRQCALRLHDEFGQALAGLNLDLTAMEKQCHGADGSAREAFACMRSRLRTIAESMRNLSQALHPSLLDELGLVPALEWYIERWKRDTGIGAQISAAGFDEKLPRPTAVTLYYIVQECLENVRKHSGASRVKIMLAKGHPHAILRVVDNGKGFSVTGGKRKRRGLGLVSMRERVEFLGGTFQIKSSPGKGAQVHAKIPIGVHSAR